MAKAAAPADLVQGSSGRGQPVATEELSKAQLNDWDGEYVAVGVRRYH